MSWIVDRRLNAVKELNKTLNIGDLRDAELDPSAATPSVFRLGRIKSGWRAGAPTRADQNSAGGGAKLFRRRRRRNSAPVRKCAHKGPNKLNNI